MSTFKILHWNDVYKVGPHKNEAGGTIDVAQFGALVEDIRAAWTTLPNGQKDGLTLFSGDLFSPSVESTITRGSHMVPVINELAPDVALTGNHDFDFGYPHLTKLVQDCRFPWILSNIVDSGTSHVLEYLHEFQVFERAGVRVGVIGLVERDWIATVSSWPANFDFKDMYEVGQELSRRLRDPQGDYRCDVIIALTHSRVPNDIALAKKLLAISPARQDSQTIADKHGVDIILGGHDHFYYVSKGIENWEGHNRNETVLGAEEDVGDVLVIKSGCDFLDLSEITITLEPTPAGSVRKQVVKQISGRRLRTASNYRSSETMRKLINTLLKSVSSSLQVPVCRLITELDLRSPHIRTRESAGGNWFADILHHAYDDALCLRGCGGADGVLICAGTLRGDSIYSPGNLTLGNILEILPFEDPIIVVELDGATLWEALEAALSLWPAQEGRFPVISGFRVEWDSGRPSGNRLLGVWLTAEMDESDHGSDAENYGALTHAFADLEPVRKEKGGRQYKIVTREYLADGHDGYDALKGQKHLIDHEGGTLMSTLVRRYLLGAQFVTNMSRVVKDTNHSQLGANTRHEVTRAKSHKQRIEVLVLNAVDRWKAFVQRKRSKTHYRNQFNVCVTEHMSAVDAFDGPNARKGNMAGIKGPDDIDDLLVVAPIVDGRLSNKAYRESTPDVMIE